MVNLFKFPWFKLHQWVGGWVWGGTEQEKKQKPEKLHEHGQQCGDCWRHGAERGGGGFGG